MLIRFGSYLAIFIGGACPQIAAANPGLQKVSFYSKFYNISNLVCHCVTLIW